MIANLSTALVGLSCVVLSSFAAQTGAEQRFLEAAKSVQHMTPSDFLYDRESPEVARLSSETPTAEIVKLLEHPESRVRALALAALSLKGEPELLPTIVRLAGDAGEAPPKRIPHAVALLAPGKSSGPAFTEEAQTVGAIARAIVGQYLQTAGYHWGIEGRGDQPGFAAYWAERREQRHCLSWFMVARMRASQETSPTPPDRIPKIGVLRARIDALETPYRDWVLLALAAPWDGGGAEPGAEVLAPEEDLVRAARRLGDERLMGLLRGMDPVPDDPDMRLREEGPFPYQRVVPFLLRHAREVLEPSHAGELLALEKRHLSGEPVGRAPRTVTARWAAAAADLEPGRGREILHAAFERFRDGATFDREDQRAILAEALWRHAGDKELEFLKDWFFGEAPQRGAFGFGRHRLADALAQPEKRALLLAILRDARLAALDWQTLRRLAVATNAAAGKAVVSEESLREAWHPLGEGHYDWEKEKARASYPKETAALEAALAGWRERLIEFARDAR